MCGTQEETEKEESKVQLFSFNPNFFFLSKVPCHELVFQHSEWAIFPCLNLIVTKAAKAYLMHALSVAYFIKGHWPQAHSVDAAKCTQYEHDSNLR